jgi:hypothetical protein
VVRSELYLAAYKALSDAGWIPHQQGDGAAPLPVRVVDDGAETASKS